MAIAPQYRDYICNLDNAREVNNLQEIRNKVNCEGGKQKGMLEIEYKKNSKM